MAVGVTALYLLCRVHEGYWEVAVHTACVTDFSLIVKLLASFFPPWPVCTAVTSDSSAAGTNTTTVEELAKEDDSEQPCPPLTERERAPAAPRIPMAEWDNPGIKLQVAPIPR